MTSRVEVNFVRLLGRCEAMASEKMFDEWRLEKYVECLQEYLKELNKSISKPTQEKLTEYNRKVTFLKGLLETEKMPTAAEKVLAAELLAPSSATSENCGAGRELLIQGKARYQKQMREELLGSHDGLRKRTEQEQDIDTVLRHHHQMQEKVADEMVHLAKTMKENAKTAGRIVRKDTTHLADSNKLAETNYTRLEVESKRLDAHVQKGCNWWLWIMLTLVCITFIWMVIFMRFYPKR